MNREDIYNIVVPIAIAIIGIFFIILMKQNSGKSNEENLLEIKVLNTW